MFDKDSFTDEITNSSEAKAAVAYLSSNEGKFRRELYEKGTDYDTLESIVRQAWQNLLESCKRVNYSDNTVLRKTTQLGL
jgi:hypothetical protein